MGMARQAPMDNYKRTFYISIHVVDRMRGRIGDPNRENLQGSMIFRDEEDLKNRIDSAIKSALANDYYENISDRGAPAKLVKIEDWFRDGNPVYILLKKDNADPRKMAAVTAFTQEQVEENRQSHRWDFGQLAVTERAKAIIPLPVPGLEIPFERRQPVSGEVVVLHYRTRDGKEHFEKFLKRSAVSRGQEIINNPSYVPNTLEAYVRLREKLIVK
jgi:hypothetical protein